MAAVKSKRVRRPYNWWGLLQAYSFGLEPGNSVYLLYANMDFNASSAKDTSKLLEFEWWFRYRWTDAQILDFLKKHQREFRECLDWIANDFFVDLGEENADRDDRKELWEQVPEVKFLRQHGFEHAGVTIEPNSGHDAGRSEYLSGIQLGQKKPRDPLDPIVWDVIAHLSVWGTVFVRRCDYSGCGRFFRPLTKRKLFCSDSCRALAHVPDEFLEPEEAAAFREERRKYMQRHRQILKQKKSTPKSQAKHPRRDYLGIGGKLPKVQNRELDFFLTFLNITQRRLQFLENLPDDYDASPPPPSEPPGPNDLIDLKLA